MDSLSSEGATRYSNRNRMKNKFFARGRFAQNQPLVQKEERNHYA
jgi:hypothetical protein